MMHVRGAGAQRLFRFMALADKPMAGLKVALMDPMMCLSLLGFAVGSPLLQVGQIVDAIPGGQANAGGRVRLLMQVLECRLSTKTQELHGFIRREKAPGLWKFGGR